MESMPPMQNPAPRVQPAGPQGQITPAVPTPPTPGAVIPSGDIAAMQARLADLRVQEIGLKAQWNGLRRQLEAMRTTNTARPAVSQEWANVGSQLAQVQGEIEVLTARIAQAQGRPVPGTIVMPGMPARRTGPDPDMIVGLSFALAMIFVVPISIAWARRIWRGKPQAPAPRMDEISPRFDRLEQAIDAIAIEVERISEGQRFVTKIMADRPAQAPAPQGIHVAAPEDKPLALGAGPAEQVQPGERQSEKEAIRRRATSL
jgi:hypothetical protein